MKLRLGPGALVAAAFVGPGTVTTCTLMGASFGFALLWVLIFATLSTIVLQEMAARLGVGAKLGLGEALMQVLSPPWAKLSVGVLIFAAIAVGNAAYQAGNLSGGALGLGAVFGEALDRRVAIVGLTGVAGALILIGRYKLIETILIGLVLVMTVAFASTVFILQPSLSAVLSGFVPRVPEGAWFGVAALIGTTVVPYNLFLHASTARQQWSDGDRLAEARSDTVLSIGLGGLISIFILATAAASLFSIGLEVKSGADMARAIEPAFGSAARFLVGFGLLAAGLTSAITAPLATGYVLSEIIPVRSEQARQVVFRIAAIAILLIGATISLQNFRPVDVIFMAQVANGILLPVVAVFLMVVMNNRRLLGDNVNGLLSNLLGGLATLTAFLVGARALLRAFGIWP